jgi:hypothetical protein
MKTALCHLLGIEHPIIAAPMGPDLTGPDLVAAVSMPAASASCRFTSERLVPGRNAARFPIFSRIRRMALA